MAENKKQEEKDDKTLKSAPCCYKGCSSVAGYECSKCGSGYCSRHMSTNVGEYSYLCYDCQGV